MRSERETGNLHPDRTLKAVGRSLDFILSCKVGRWRVLNRGATWSDLNTLKTPVVRSIIQCCA